MTRLFLGIDAGASKTLCLVGDAHAVLGRGMAGSANPNVAGLDGHTQVVREAAAAAFADAGLTARPVSRAWLGVAGSERSETRNRIEAAAAAALDAERSPVLSALAADLGALAFRVRPLEAEPACGALELARRPPVSAIRHGQPRR